MKVQHSGVDHVTAAFAIGTTALGAAASTTIGAAWEPVTMIEVAIGAGGGLLGGLAYARVRSMGSALSIITSVLLAATWCAFLAPVVMHVAAMMYPVLRDTLMDRVVTFGVAAILGAIGMTLYEGLLGIIEALGDALPEKADDVLDWIFGGHIKRRKKGDEE